MPDRSAAQGREPTRIPMGGVDKCLLCGWQGRSAASVYHHVRQEDLRSGSALDVDPPFPAFDVVHRQAYERLAEEAERLRDALDEIDAQTSGAFSGESQTLNRLATIRAAIDTVKDVS